MEPIWWSEPTAGDIVWCHFPDNIHPKPKPRPALILVVYDDNDPQFSVKVAYGTSQRTKELYGGEFAISKALNSEAYKMAGLSYDTKFDLRQMLDLPYNSDWFSIPPTALHGQIPKLGTLHPVMMRHLQAAIRGASE